jgi:hypothetical protein
MVRNCAQEALHLKLGKLIQNKGDFMQTQNAKEIMINIIASQPEDASFEEIMRELSFERMIERGMEDVRKGRVISSQEMERRIRTW